MNLPENITRGFGRKVLTIKKQSPHIFFVAGVIGSVTSTVLACRATLKLEKTLDEIKADLHTVMELKNDVDVENYDEIQYRKDVAYVYAMGGMELAKLYGPSVIIGAASVALLTGSHVQLTRRNGALMAAYAAVQEAYNEYRNRVRAELGDERELEIYRQGETNAVECAESKTRDPNSHSPYAVFFDEFSPNWEKDPELNRLFIQCQQTYANNLLRSRGHVFLNEIYDMLGVDRTRAGAVVGWVIGHDGDNYIDFGIFNPENSRFVNGMERSILLDFNVDGVIYDKI